MAIKKNLTFDLHGFQRIAWKAIGNPKYKIICLISGIQGGKTTFLALALRKAIKYLKQGNYIVGSPSYPILTQSTLPTFQKYFSKTHGEYKAQEKRFLMKKYGNVWFRSGTDPDSVEGIPDCKFAVIDEAGKCSYPFYENMVARLARTNGQLVMATTPYAMNWLYHEIYKPAESGERDDICLVTFRSKDNPAFPEEEYEKQKAILDAKTFKRKFDGIFERMEGLVWELDRSAVCEPIELPAGTKYFAGVDWGYEHPFALLIRAITPDKRVYEVSEFKKSHLDPNEKVQLAKAKCEQWGVEMVFADPEDPAMIAAFNKAGIRTMAFHVGKEDYKRIVPGVELHASLMKSGRYRVFGTCKQLLDEYETYHWPEEGQERPVALNDDLMCAMRYVTVGTKHLMEGRPIKVQLPLGVIVDDWRPGKEKRQKSWAAY